MVKVFSDSINDEVDLKNTEIFIVNWDISVSSLLLG